jgi:alpha-D-xyloside xylohydrolase
MLKINNHQFKIQPASIMITLKKLAGASLAWVAAATVLAANPQPPLLNDPVDVSGDFHDLSNFYYLADQLKDFDPATHVGKIVWQRSQYSVRHAFDNDLAALRPAAANEFPENQYAANPALPFSIDFVSPKTFRLRLTSGPQVHHETEELMLAGPVPHDGSWKYEKVDGGYRYASACGSVTILEKPWHVEIRDASGRLLTKTDHADDNKSSFTPVLPFSFVRRSADYSRSINAAFTLAPGEKIFGCGESFTGLDKRGQKIVLWTDDANGIENPGMYKPIPFFMSNRGYGMFMHTSTPITCDFGNSFSGVNSLMIGDDELDLFVFLGSPKEILDEYTRLTGKSPLPPLWSFGLWMSRCTYNAEKQVRDIAGKLRADKIPCDVLHLDTGWFETDWQCDYEFSPTRFADPKKMLSDLKADGFRVSCWQLPYFVPKNKLFPELLEKNLVVRDAKGNLPYEDAVLDFSNPKTVEWYQAKLASLLNLGVAAIKVDFGEAAPNNGIWSNGRTGFYEHNLFPLRYNKAVADITKQTTGENIIWARSAWAGSQRYPIHWGGDAESTDAGMAAELRGGLSFGLSGFSFWSHDIGGFTANSVSAMDQNLFARWLAFGMLSSHSRCHGEAPKEPWNYGTNFMNEFRVIDELKYRLMPYVYAQARMLPITACRWCVRCSWNFRTIPAPGWWMTNIFTAPAFSSRRCCMKMKRRALFICRRERGLIIRPAKIMPAAGRKLRPVKFPKSFWCATARCCRTSRWRNPRRRWTGRKSSWSFMPRTRRRRPAPFSCPATAKRMN